MSKKIFIIFILVCLLLPFLAGSVDRSSCQKRIILTGSELGTESNPVKCDMEAGEVEYLDRLRDESGKPVQYRRIGHAHPDCQGHILDKFELISGGGSVCVEIYMDMYCQGSVENLAVTGFDIIDIHDLPVKYICETAAMTVQDVYGMICDNGFFCEVIERNLLYEEGLKNIKMPGDGVFHSKRNVLAGRENDNTIATSSKAKFIPTGSVPGDIKLKWIPEIEQCTFKEAVKTTEYLNREINNKGGGDTWRIPTLMEIFSIVEESARNHFPAVFAFPADINLTFWTATPVKKEGTVLDYDKENKAYYVLQSKYNINSGTHSLNFSIRNVTGTEEKAVLIPVNSQSGKMYTYIPAKPETVPTPTPTPLPSPKPVPTPTPRLNNQPDMIPGFDDVEDLKKTKQETPTQIKKPTQKFITSPTPAPKTSSSSNIPGFDDTPNIRTTNRSQATICLFPCLQDGTPKMAKSLEKLDKKIGSSLKKLKSWLEKKLVCSLQIEAKKTANPADMAVIDNLYTILSNPNLSENEKFNSIFNALMRPQGIDIIIAVQAGETGNNVDVIKPIILSAIERKIYSVEIFQGRSNEGVVTRYISDSIISIMKKGFKAR